MSQLWILYCIPKLSHSFTVCSHTAGLLDRAIVMALACIASFIIIQQNDTERQLCVSKPSSSAPAAFCEGLNVTANTSSDAHEHVK